MPLTHSDQQPLHYLDLGAGPNTLWVHGAGGNAAIWWQQAEHFSKSRHFVAYDHRGFARSPCPMSEVSVTKVVGDACAVMNAAGMETASLICQSLGGWTGIRMALEHPERVEKLVLSCTMAGINHPPAIESVLASSSLMDERGPASIAVGTKMTKENPLKAYLYEQAGAFNETFNAAELPDFFVPETLVPLDGLANVKCPVLVISGEDDILWPPHTLEGIVEALPNARQEIVKGSGHSPYFERPDVFNGLVEDFLNE